MFTEEDGSTINIEDPKNFEKRALGNIIFIRFWGF